MTFDEMLKSVRARFNASGVENPALDARVLVMRGAGINEVDLISRGASPLSEQQIEIIEQMVSRRLMGEPVSRILGGREFWGLWFKVTPDTLDPRPDTETLVSAALDFAKRRQFELGRPLRLLDLGTGSGCILISLLSELKEAHGVGIDLNAGAVAVSCENNMVNGVGDRAEFRVGSWFDAVKEGELFDLILSNPPYIPHDEIESLAVEVKNHDPILALSGGSDGLGPYKIILGDVKKHLACGGHVFFEIGQGQEVDIARLAMDAGLNHIESYSDLSGIIRVGVS